MSVLFLVELRGYDLLKRKFIKSNWTKRCNHKEYEEQKVVHRYLLCLCYWSLLLLNYNTILNLGGRVDQRIRSGSACPPWIFRKSVRETSYPGRLRTLVPVPETGLPIINTIHVITYFLWAFIIVLNYNLIFYYSRLINYISNLYSLILHGLSQEPLKNFQWSNKRRGDNV